MERKRKTPLKGYVLLAIATAGVQTLFHVAGYTTTTAMISCVAMFSVGYFMGIYL